MTAHRKAGIMGFVVLYIVLIAAFLIGYAIHLSNARERDAERLRAREAEERRYKERIQREREEERRRQQRAADLERRNRELEKQVERMKRESEYVARREHITEQRRLMTDSLRYDVMRRDNFRCVLCGATADDGVKLHVDHIFPVSKGGNTEMSNLRTLCERCNMGKSDKIEAPASREVMTDK